VAELRLDWGAAPGVYASKGDSNGTTEQTGCRQSLRHGTATRDVWRRILAVCTNQGRGRYPAQADPRAQSRRPVHRRLGVIQQPEGAPNSGADAAEAAASIRTSAPERVGAHGTVPCRARGDRCRNTRRARGESRTHRQLRHLSGKELTCLATCTAFGPALRSYRIAGEDREEAVAGSGARARVLQTKVSANDCLVSAGHYLCSSV
jgi:hypothetical protein